MSRTTDGWIRAYKTLDALWIHGGNPKQPHALLASGKHSNGFFNSRLVIPHDRLLHDACLDLLDIFSDPVAGGDLSKVRGIVGPQTGATKLAEYLSKIVAIWGNQGCFSASPAKNRKNGIKSMVFTGGQKKLLAGQNILLCEDVLTTGGSVEMAEKAVKEQGGIVLPFILVLVNRSGFSEVAGKKIVALIDHPMPIWTPKECPLCKQGSEVVRPKDNWARLTDPCWYKS